MIDEVEDVGMGCLVLVETRVPTFNTVFSSILESVPLIPGVKVEGWGIFKANPSFFGIIDESVEVAMARKRAKTETEFIYNLF